MTNFEKPSPVFSPRAAAISLGLFLLAMTACVAVPRALTFLPGVVSLFGVLYLYARHRSFPRIDCRLVYFFVAFVLLAALSAIWSPDSGYTLEKAGKVAGLFFSGIMVLAFANSFPKDFLRTKEFAFVASLLCAVCAALIAYEYSSSFHLARLVLGIDADDVESWPAPIRGGFLMNRSSVFIVLLSVPTLLLLWRSPLARKTKVILGLSILFALGVLIANSESQTALIAAALALGMLFFPSQNNTARKVLLAGVLAIVLISPLIPKIADGLMSDNAKNAQSGFLVAASIPHRLEVWTFISEKIVESPIYGHGMESTRHLRAGYIMPRMNSDQVIHPHNAVLQIWVEFGIIGIVLVSAFFILIFRRIDNASPTAQKYHLLMFATLLGTLSISYGLWQAWVIGMVFALVGYGSIILRITETNAAEK